MGQLARYLLIALILTMGAISLPRSAAADESWRELSPRERYDTLRNYQEHRNRPKDKRREVESEYKRWRDMPPERRDEVRRNFDRYQRMPPEEQQRFQRKYEKWRHERP